MGALGVVLGIGGCQKSPEPTTSDHRWVIEQDTVLGPGIVEIQQPLVILHATLRLVPPTTLIFSPSTYLLVGDSGRLIARGTPQDSIILTGQPTWQGLILAAEEAGSDLRYVAIRNATGTANLLLLSHRRTTLSHVVFRGASHFGLALGANASPARLDSCAFLENQELPIYSHDIGGLLRFGSTLTFQDNGDPRILIEGTSTTTESGTLSIRNYPIVFSEGWTIRSEIWVQSSVQLFLGKALRVVAGRFEALGVTLSGLEGGAWPGMVIEGGALRLDSTRIVKGGNGTDAALNLLGGHPIVVRNTFIDSSQSHGVFVATPVDTFEGNAIRYAQGYPIVVSEPQYFPRIENTVYEGNTHPYVRVSGISLQGSATWENPGLPVLLNGLLLEGPSAPVLTLLPGLTLVFLSSGKLEVGFDPSGLIADGVTLTALLDSAGWTGVVVGPEITTFQLQNSIVEYGGRAKATVDSGNITIHETTVPVIQNSILRNSRAYGIYLVGSANDPDYRAGLLSQNQFSGNALGDIGPPARIQRP